MADGQAGIGGGGAASLENKKLNLSAFDVWAMGITVVIGGGWAC
jgi:hypothetical protein